MAEMVIDGRLQKLVLAIVNPAGVDKKYIYVMVDQESVCEYYRIKCVTKTKQGRSGPGP